ncbi:hypothetical protein ASE04_04850 [Rhizobium sp. Root708]|uniref:hypothetical protein n=1 Tax=Rhizobium sp. Root708 TaxID=1736592 RepID=UPI0006F95027|nr:hypothetical protein [Rhizobium sp. Root708]KRB55056.1 hypothetical protein ASE04_04850 [Rhizobium sp. Root708]
MHVTYHVDKHDGGWAYHVDQVWSETFSDHGSALKAARAAASRQGTSDASVLVTYENTSGQWVTELAGNGERVDANVVDT